MGTTQHKPEDVVAKLRQVDVLVSQGQSVGDAIRTIGVTEVTDYRWQGVRWSEERPGTAHEGPGDREPAAPEGDRGSHPR